MEKIGLYGGSFDPIHAGHLLVARAAQEELKLDRLIFIPAAVSPFKPDQELAPGSERLRLLRLALAGQNSWEIDDQEIVRGGISYSIETVRRYQDRKPQAKYFYLIGADQAPQLPLWRDAAELAQRIEFAVISRPGEKPGKAPAPFRSLSIAGFVFGVSSSEIRRRVRAGLSIDWMVPRAVKEAISQNRLYI